VHKIKFLLASFIDFFDTQCKVICRSVDFNNLYWFLFQELSRDQVKRHPDTLVGAPAQADVSDPYIQEIASAAVAEVDRRSNALYRQKVVRIVEAQKQVS
jgi:hypothetical protein